MKLKIDSIVKIVSEVASTKDADNEESANEIFQTTEVI